MPILFKPCISDSVSMPSNDILKNYTSIKKTLEIKQPKRPSRMIYAVFCDQTQYHKVLFDTLELAKKELKQRRDEILPRAYRLETDTDMEFSFLTGGWDSFFVRWMIRELEVFTE